MISRSALVSICLVSSGLVWMVSADYKTELEEIVRIMDNNETMTTEQYEKAKQAIEDARADTMSEEDATQVRTSLEQYYILRGRALADLAAAVKIMENGEQMTKEEYDRGMKALDDLAAADMPPEEVADTGKAIKCYYAGEECPAGSGSTSRSALVPLAVSLSAVVVAWGRV